MSSPQLNLLKLGEPRVRTLHFTWIAFFITFVIWFNHAPLVVTLRDSFAMTTEQWKALLILNVALTIPARVVIGMLVDRFGPRAAFAEGQCFRDEGRQLLHIRNLPTQNRAADLDESERLPLPPDLNPGMKIDGWEVEKTIASARHPTAAPICFPSASSPTKWSPPANIRTAMPSSAPTVRASSRACPTRPRATTIH